MANFGSVFKKDVERRIKSGDLKVSASTGADINHDKKQNKEMIFNRGMSVRKMNGLESSYAQYLEALKSVGDVVWWEYESVKLRLADKTFYTPDFFLQRSDGTFEVHETKGFMREDANVKLKVANEKFPWKFYLVKRGKAGNWDIKRVGNEPDF